MRVRLAKCACNCGVCGNVVFVGDEVVVTRRHGYPEAIHLACCEGLNDAVKAEVLKYEE